MQMLNNAPTIFPIFLSRVPSLVHKDAIILKKLSENLVSPLAPLHARIIKETQQRDSAACGQLAGVCTVVLEIFFFFFSGRDERLS
jgi:hypothetical protein